MSSPAVITKSCVETVGTGALLFSTLSKFTSYSPSQELKYSEEEEPKVFCRNSCIITISAGG